MNLKEYELLKAAHDAIWDLYTALNHEYMHKENVPDESIRKIKHSFGVAKLIQYHLSNAVIQAAIVSDIDDYSVDATDAKTDGNRD